VDQSKEAQRVFEALKGYVGPALHVIRRQKGKSRKSLAKILEEKFSWHRENIDIDAIESGDFELTFEKFRHLCLAIRCTAEEVFALAIFYKDSDSGKTTKQEESLERLTAEAQYKIWRRQQRET